VERPVITNEQRIEISIRIAKLVCSDIKWNAWADKWLSGEDRTKSSAAAHYAAVCFTDKDEFNKKLIELIEMVCKK